MLCVSGSAPAPPGEGAGPADQKGTLNSNMVKLIAIAAMTLDHIAWAVFPGYPRELLPVLMHVIGRITCPIMCYFIAEGYHYTRNINRYTFRLFLFVFLSHFAYVFASMDFVDARSLIPFCYGSPLNQTSVMWSLAWGLVMLRVANSERIKRAGTRVLLILLLCAVSFPSDWSCVASLCVLAFGTNRGRFGSQMLWMVFFVAIYAVVYFFAIDRVYGLLQMAVVLSAPVLASYNGEQGKVQRANPWIKWMFYLYYPLHLLVIGFVQASG